MTSKAFWDLLNSLTQATLTKKALCAGAQVSVPWRESGNEPVMSSVPKVFMVASANKL